MQEELLSRMEDWRVRGSGDVRPQGEMDGLEWVVGLTVVVAVLIDRMCGCVPICVARLSE